jgi:hypothetical protein
MFDLIEDVYGAIADIPEHAEGYGTDPTRIVVTGDSAGGHTKKMISFFRNSRKNVSMFVGTMLIS